MSSCILLLEMPCENPICLLQGSSDHLIETLMKMHCSLHARKLALLLSNDTHNNDTPIVEAAACNVNCAISGQNQLREQPQNQNEPQGQLQQLAGTNLGLLST